MTLSRVLAQQQVTFERTARLRGQALTLGYGGPWTRDPATGAVTPAPLPAGQAASLVVPGLLGLNGPSSLWLSEKQKKWGQTFDPDGLALFPQRVPVQNLISLTDGRSGQVYDIAAVPPDTFVESVCRAVYVRQGPIFPKRVSAAVNDDDTDATYTLFKGLPCRLTPAHGDIGTGMDGDAVEVSTLTAFLEYPLVVQGSGLAGPGVFPGVAAGQGVFLYPDNVVTDDPSLYGGLGPVKTYRVLSHNLDPGGESIHHCRHLVSLQPV